MKTKWWMVALLVSAAAAWADGKAQTTCPVMKGMAVDANSRYVDVEGYRIYVCCGGCTSAIQADPAKYIAQMQAEGVELAKTPAE